MRKLFAFVGEPVDCSHIELRGTQRHADFGLDPSKEMACLRFAFASQSSWPILDHFSRVLRIKAALYLHRSCSAGEAGFVVVR
jgi:hypothetical protein